MATKPVYTDAQVIASLTNTGGAAWRSSVISYNFPTSIASSATESRGFSHATANQQAMTDYWMHAWDSAIGASITRVADSSKANITIANSAAPNYAYAYYPNSSGTAGVFLNSAYGDNSGTNNLVNPKLGEWGGMAIGHEIGHALGLSHPGNYNGGSPTYAADAVYLQDSQQYTIMSYFTAANTGSDWVASDSRMHYAQTPMLNDILALQALYGVDQTVRSTDTTYGFHSTLAASVFDFSFNPHPVLCILDAGGVDTIDLSGYSSASRISLIAGTFSDCDAMTNNLSIARNVTIENALGGSGNDTLIGNGAANRLDGGAGADSMSGGAGNDSYVVDNSLDRVTELASQGTDLVSASISYLLAANLENLTLTGTAAINATGNELANLLVGNSGNNLLDGRAGADSMSGGLGNDSYLVDNSLDRVTELASQGSDLVSASVSYVLGANLENLTLTGTAAINGSGNALANVLVGNSGNNVLDGGAGADSISGGAGNDTYLVDNSLDRITELANQGSDLVSASISYALLANLENLTLTGTAAINGTGNELANILIGNSGNNLLSGGVGNDLLNGGSGNDILIGGGGLDQLSGGAGADIFRFVGLSDSAVGANRDRITDFGSAQGDKIDFSQLTASSARLANSQFFHWTDSGFSGHAGDLYARADVLMCDLNGDAQADFEVQLVGVTQIQHDFVLM